MGQELKRSFSSCQLAALRTLLDDPDDAHACAVAGDWLLARGDPWGEFVSAAIAVDRGDPAARRRARALERSIAERLLAPLSTLPHVAFEATWTFGFLDRLQLRLRPGHDLDAISRALREVPGLWTVRDLTLGAAPDLHTVAAHIARDIELPHLRCVWLGHRVQTVAWHAGIPPWVDHGLPPRSGPNVFELPREDNLRAGLAPLCAAFASLRDVLWIASDPSTHELDDLPPLRNLTLLTTTRFSPTFLRRVAQLEVEGLYLWSALPTDYEPLLAAGPGLAPPGLQRLGLGHSTGTDRLAARIVAEGSGLERLTHLSLHAGSSSDAAAARLVEASPQLAWLDLSLNRLSEGAVEQLGKIVSERGGTLIADAHRARLARWLQDFFLGEQGQWRDRVVEGTEEALPLLAANMLRNAKAFTRGQRVFVHDAHWGMGGESAMVVARRRRRGSWGLYTISATNLHQVRPKLVYEPGVIQALAGRRITPGIFSHYWPFEVS